MVFYSKQMYQQGICNVLLQTLIQTESICIKNIFNLMNSTLSNPFMNIKVIQITTYKPTLYIHHLHKSSPTSLLLQYNIF